MRLLVILVAVAAVALGGTALAAPGGGPLGGLFGEEPEKHEAEFARDLASKLGGVSPEQVERALEEVRDERAAEHRAEMARGLAAELDGVSADRVEGALARAHQRLEEGREQGEPPDPRLFEETLAKELDTSEGEIRKALRAAHRAQLQRQLDEAVKAGRLTEEQAKEIRQRLERDAPPPGGRRFLHRAPGPPGPPPMAVPLDGPAPHDIEVPAPPPPGEM